MRLRPFEPLLVAFAGALAACSTENPGTPPPVGEFHYPIAAAISRDSNHLYVVNSDFNLQYNGGRVNVVNLAQVRDAIAACPSGVCAPATAAGAENAFITDSVRINPFANAAALRTNPTTGQARLYVLVRGDGTVTWMDVSPDGSQFVRQPCEGGAGCIEVNRTGDQAAQSPRGLTIPTLPVAMNVDDDGYITLSHQESPRARVSLLYDGDFSATGPRLVHYVGDLPANQSAILRVNPGSVAPEQPYWYAFSREQPFVSHLHAFPDANPDRSFLFSSRVAALPGVASDLGVRYVTRDPHPGRPRAFATTRPGTPASGTMQHSPEAVIDLDLSDPVNPVVRNVLELPLGPAQVVAIDNPGPGDHTILYAVSYDARKIYVVDAEDWREIDQITTELGPHALIPDPSLAPGHVGPVHPYLYLVNFAAMCVEVINVDPASPVRHRVVFTIGDPTRPRANL